MRSVATWLFLCVLACVTRAHAADCGGPSTVAYRALPMDDGREISVWYPAAPGAAALRQAGEPAKACGHWPIVLFSHGLAGCGTQAIFITRQIAQHGYVVVAPNHHDA